MSARLLLCGVLLGALAACRGGQTTLPKGDRVLEELRAKAAAAPDDAPLWTALLEHELLGPSGDSARARLALDHLRKLDPASVRVRFLGAEAALLEGNPSAALDGFLYVLQRVDQAQDPLGAVMAEAAVNAVIDMNDAIDSYRAKVDDVMAVLPARRAALGLHASHLVQLRQLSRAAQRGDLAAMAAAAEQAGCVQQAAVLGPFGPRDLLGFDRKWPFEVGALPKEADLGPGRGLAPLRQLSTRRCVLPLGRGSHDPAGGTSFVRATLEAPADGTYALRLESPNSVELALDDRPLFRFDLRKLPAFGATVLPLELRRGKHELAIKVTTRHPNPALSLALVAASSADFERSEVGTATGPLARFLAAKLWLSRGNVIAAREELRAQGGDKTAAVLVLEAAVALADPLVPAELRRDRARELLRKAQQRDPQAWYPAVGLSSLAAAEGRLREAIDELRASIERWPQVVAIETNLIERLRERGWVEEADARIAALRERMPRTCALLGFALATAKSRNREHEVETLSEEAMRCDATSTARFSRLRAERKYQAAVAELVRLRSLGDPATPEESLEAELELRELAGDDAALSALREKRRMLWPDRPEPWLGRADELLAAGHREEARTLLGSGLAAHPAELYELWRVAEGLGHEGLFKGLRKDAREVIRAFEASGRTYNEPQVLVLDYTVVRIFEDGSSVDLTHNIMRVQSQEAVDESGEYTPPEGARLLSLRTIKADGTSLEPEAINGKNSLSLPNLSVGDYVEFEFVRGAAPSAGFPGGFLGERFYFKSFEVPFDHSELVVILPPSMEPVLDPRGPAPQTVRETRDGLTVLRFSTSESRPLVAEPLSVASREFLPSINLGVKVGWAAYVESLRDLLADRDVFDPAAAALVGSLLAGLESAPASRRAAQLYHWVLREIEPTEDTFGIAAAMLRSRTGSRDRVLRYMLGLAGIESELVIVRGAEADHTPALLPDPDTFGHLLLRVQTEQGERFLYTGARGAPFGYVPPTLRKETGLLLDEKASPVTVTDAGSSAGDLRQIDIDLEVQPAGGAKIHVRETFHGAGAIRWRGDLEEIPAAELEARFEHAYASRVLSGSKLTALAVEGREDPEAPLVLDYRVEIASFGRREGRTQYLPSLFASQLSQSFARTSVRKFAELIGAELHNEVRIRISVPAGVTVSTASSKAATHAFAGAQFSSSFVSAGGTHTLARSLSIPVLRVSPADYPSFAAFCRAVDMAEGGELALEWP